MGVGIGVGVGVGLGFGVRVGVALATELGVVSELAFDAVAGLLAPQPEIKAAVAEQPIMSAVLRMLLRVDRIKPPRGLRGGYGSIYSGWIR